MPKRAKRAFASSGLTARVQPVLNPFSKGRTNQRQGASFEAFVAFMAQREGLMAISNGLRAKRLSDRIIAQRSNLDWLILGQAEQGEVLMADSKSFAGERFGQSMLDARQRALAEAYAARGFCSGFIVHLRGAGTVNFYHARLLARPRRGFGAADGVPLGTLQDFRISMVWQLDGSSDGA